MGEKQINTLKKAWLNHKEEFPSLDEIEQNVRKTVEAQDKYIQNKETYIKGYRGGCMGLLSAVQGISKFSHQDSESLEGYIDIYNEQLGYIKKFTKKLHLDHYPGLPNWIVVK